VAAHPQTWFYLVINPDSGPGTSGTQPNEFYDICVPQLRPSSNPNSKVLGYVQVGTRTTTAITADIDTYAGWNTSARPSGILFDGITASSAVAYQSIVSHARSKGFTLIILDAGRTPSADYYSLADFVVTYESNYTSFSISDLAISSSSPASKQTVILTNTPATAVYSTMISQLSSADVGAVYITNLDDSISGVPQQWAAFVNAVGGPPSGTTTTTSSIPSSVKTLSTTSASNTSTSTSSSPITTSTSSESNLNTQTAGLSSHSPSPSAADPEPPPAPEPFLLNVPADPPSRPYSRLHNHSPSESFSQLQSPSEKAPTSPYSDFSSGTYPPRNWKFQSSYQPSETVEYAISETNTAVPSESGVSRLRDTMYSSRTRATQGTSMNSAPPPYQPPTNNNHPNLNSGAGPSRPLPVDYSTKQSLSHNIFYETGFEDGFEHGKIHGLIEGRALGRAKGFEVWEELGFYEGFAHMWKAIFEKQGRNDERAMNHMQRLLDLISQFPRTNPSDTDETDFPKLFRQIRSRYKALCSTLGVRPTLRYSDRSQDRDGTADASVSEVADDQPKKTVWSLEKGAPRPVNGHAFDF
ncbi:hypothetical protein H0H93_011510, partial [Arthromyces matolae]